MLKVQHWMMEGWQQQLENALSVNKVNKSLFGRFAYQMVGLIAGLITPL